MAVEHEGVVSIWLKAGPDWNYPLPANPALVFLGVVPYSPAEPT